MTIVFHPSYNKVSREIIEDENLQLDVTAFNAGTIFVLLGLPANTPGYGQIFPNVYRTKFITLLNDISKADVADYFLEEDCRNPEVRYRFNEDKRKLCNIIAFCLGANCSLDWG